MRAWVKVEKPTCGNLLEHFGTSNTAEYPFVDLDKLVFRFGRLI